MSSPSNNKELYSGIEFATWLDLAKLWPEEEYLIEKYLNPNLSIVEAGTNGGRILLRMQEMGFTDLAGFDYVPALIDQAIERDPLRTIDFQVQDAIDLAYRDCSFDQIIYLQQIICLIEQREDRLKALHESYRILKPGGIGLFSVLSFESRSSRKMYATYFKYLTILRKLRGDDRNIQYLPWLRLGGKFNFNAILDRPPFTYWYRVTEIYDLLKSVGFEIVSMGTDTQIGADSLKTTDRELLGEQLSGMLYIVVRK
jgi:ubiquinone/menaquinone biosynthesis C-methylase UbiE